MKWLKKIFHRHHWKEIKREHVWLYLNGREHDKTDGQSVIEHCPKCNTYRAYTTNGYTRQKMDIDYAASTMDVRLD